MSTKQHDETEVCDAGFTAADMATAAAQGFRDGQAVQAAVAAGWVSVDERLPEWAARDDTPCFINNKAAPPTPPRKPTASQQRRAAMSERAFHTTGYITPAQPRTNDVARAIVEAADMNDRVLAAIDAEFAAPAQQPWQYTPPAPMPSHTLQTASQPAPVRELIESLPRYSPRKFKAGPMSSMEDEDGAFLCRHHVLDAIGAALASADSVLEDAKRYRWLRSNAIGAFRTNDGKGPVSVYHLCKIPPLAGIPEETDAAIDAAIAAQGDSHE